jgi:hypothetical protein
MYCVQKFVVAYNKRHAPAGHSLPPSLAVVNEKYGNNLFIIFFKYLLK